MIEADTFDMDTMLVMFKELQTKQIKAAAEGVDGISPEMRKFIEEAKAQGVTRCPIRDIEEQVEKCPVDLKTTSPEDAKSGSRAVHVQRRGRSSGVMEAQHSRPRRERGGVPTLPPRPLPGHDADLAIRSFPTSWPGISPSGATSTCAHCYIAAGSWHAAAERAVHR